MKKWIKFATIADRFAIPFWIILIVYSLNEIKKGNILGYIPLTIGTVAFIIDSIFAIKNKKV